MFHCDDRYVKDAADLKSNFDSSSSLLIALYHTSNYNIVIFQDGKKVPNLTTVFLFRTVFDLILF